MKLTKVKSNLTMVKVKSNHGQVKSCVKINFDLLNKVDHVLPCLTKVKRNLGDQQSKKRSPKVQSDKDLTASGLRLTLILTKVKHQDGQQYN